MRVPTLVVTDVLMLWPRQIGALATVEEAGLWPVFVLVVEEPAEPRAAGPLFELLARQRPDGELAVVAARCDWSILDRDNALLKASMRGSGSARFAANLIVPARQVLGVLDVVARGATIGVATGQGAERLTGRVDIRSALHEVVLLSCPPSVDLATLADLLGATVSH